MALERDPVNSSCWREMRLPSTEGWGDLQHPVCSVAILLYLSRKYHAAAHWYPPELQACARVDEYLAWQHTAVQLPATNVYLCKVRLPALGCRLRQEPERPVLERTRWHIHNLPTTVPARQQ